MKGFKVGYSGNPEGRKKGTPNKVTQEARELFIQTLEGEVKHIQEAFEKIRDKDPGKYLELFAKYATYFVPKKVDLSSNDMPVVFNVGYGKPDRSTDKS